MRTYKGFTFLFKTQREKNKSHLLIACIKNIGVPSWGVTGRKLRYVISLEDFALFAVMLCLLELGEKKVTFLPEGEEKKKEKTMYFHGVGAHNRRFLKERDRNPPVISCHSPALHPGLHSHNESKRQG